MQKTAYDHPLLQSVMSFIARSSLKLFGWRIEGELPKLKKYVLIGAPHTSNWDFVIFLHVAFSWKAKLFWMGKKALFKGWRNGIMRWLGGVSVDRSKSMNLVDQMVLEMNKSEEMILVVPPEGTRSKVTVWKSGFYHIAHNAQVPIVMAYVDFQDKVVGVRAETMIPSGDYDNDLQEIIEFYRPFRGKRPELGVKSGKSTVPGEKDQ